jgi:hypothetical protein
MLWFCFHVHATARIMPQMSAPVKNAPAAGWWAVGGSRRGSNFLLGHEIINGFISIQLGPISLCQRENRFAACYSFPIRGQRRQGAAGTNSI